MLSDSSGFMNCSTFSAVNTESKKIKKQTCSIEILPKNEWSVRIAKKECCSHTDEDMSLPSRVTHDSEKDCPGNTKGGSTTVQLTSCLTGLESAV
jgi:hypothetical protein